LFLVANIFLIIAPFLVANLFLIINPFLVVEPFPPSSAPFNRKSATSFAALSFAFFIFLSSA
jgi:hypothetical protein